MKGMGKHYVLRINKRAKYSCDMKGTFKKHDDTHAGLRIFYDERADDHYVMIRIKDGAAKRLYWTGLERR